MKKYAIMINSKDAYTKFMRYINENTQYRWANGGGTFAPSKFPFIIYIDKNSFDLTYSDSDWYKENKDIAFYPDLIKVEEYFQKSNFKDSTDKELENNLNDFDAIASEWSAYKGVPFSIIDVITMLLLTKSFSKNNSFWKYISKEEREKDEKEK